MRLAARFGGSVTDHSLVVREGLRGMAHDVQKR